MVNILVVEDDVKLNQIVCTYLNDHGYAAVGCLDADTAYSKLGESKFDMIISDVMMPGVDGIEFAQNIRYTDPQIPILFITARDDLATKQKSFQVGVDDYMVKPIEMEELMLRVGAILRRSNIASSRQLTIGSLSMDMEEHTVYVNDREIPLTVREFDLLFKMLSYPKKTFTRNQLMDEFWGYDSPSGPRAVDVYMTKLREKFSGCPDFEIVTVHGLGYKVVTK